MGGFSFFNCQNIYQSPTNLKISLWIYCIGVRNPVWYQIDFHYHYILHNGKIHILDFRCHSTIFVCKRDNLQFFSVKYKDLENFKFFSKIFFEKLLTSYFYAESICCLKIMRSGGSPLLKKCNKISQNLLGYPQIFSKKHRFYL